MSGERYPLPSHAAAIWLAGDTLYVSFEGAVGPDGNPARGHTIALPLAKCSVEESSWGQPLARQLGWATLLSVLRERARMAHAPRTIATAAAPSSYQIEGMLRAMRYDRKGQREWLRRRIDRSMATSLSDIFDEE